MKPTLRYAFGLILLLNLTVISSKHLLAQDPDPSLVAWWSFDDGTATDRSGYGHNGILMGNPRFVPGPCGQAVAFNGIDQYIRIPKSPVLTSMTEMTLCYWIKFYNDVPDLAGNTIGNGSDDVPGTPGFYTYSGYTQIAYFLGVQPTARGIRVPYDATIPLDRQEYSFMVFVVSKDSLKAYRNGCLVEAISREGWNLARDWDWFIGWSGDYSGDADFLEGMMDEIRIYNRPLSEDELFNLYTQCGGRPVTTQYPNAEICAGEERILDGITYGGTKPYRYSWTPATGLSSATDEVPVASPSSTTTYTLTVTDTMGCSTSQEVTVVVNDCNAGDPEYSYTLPSLCPGTRKRDYVLFHDTTTVHPTIKGMDTIKAIAFIGENGAHYTLDTTLPLIAPPSGDIRIPVIYGGGISGVRQGIMRLKGWDGTVQRVLLSSEVSSSDGFSLNFTTLRMNAGSRPIDTCIEVMSIYPVPIDVTDTVWLTSHQGCSLLSPSLPVQVRSGENMELCFHIASGSGYDTLVLGAESKNEEYTTCISHIIVIDRTSSGTLDVSEVETGTGGLHLFPLYPNPASEEMNVRFALPRSGTVDVNIVDERGESVRSLLKGAHYSEGEHEFRCDVRGLKPGVYHLRIVSGEVGEVKSFVIVR